MKNPIKIIPLNVSYGLMTDKLVSYIQSNIPSTSVFCFQEVDDKTKKTLDSVFINSGYSAHYSSKNDGQESFMLATYIKTSFDVLYETNILEKQSGCGLAASFYIKHYSDRTLNIVNFHGYPRPGTKLDTAKRISQSKEIINHILPNADLTVIAGDYNLMPNTKSLQLFVDYGFQDLVSEYGIKNTRTHIAWDKYPGSKQHFADYFFVKSDTDRLTVSNLTTEEIVLSDHLPLVLELVENGTKYFSPNTKLVSNSGNTSMSQVLNAEKQV